MQQAVQHIQGLVDHVEDNLSEDINIPQLADSFHVSSWHFQRLFKALVGDTVGGYVRGRRLTEAARLLSHTHLGIIDIAFSVGFGSHEAFTRSFKAYFGQSPADFRKNRPVVILNEKPLLSTKLVRHLASEIKHVPTITTVPAQIIVGIPTAIPSPFATDEIICESLGPLWRTLLKRQAEIKDQQPTAFYAITASPSGNFTEDTLNFIAGIPVGSADSVPEGMVVHTFPEQLVAMFDVAVLDKDTVLKTINYIYGYWLPNSPYVRGSGSDYELFDEYEGFINPDSGSRYIIPIVPK
ncbi:MAG TPA: AraC family transcriptional regulator [Candidatus Saccharimonadales bacterium]|nr:AraC family transcriptional regulator [Candidatus Saccharimonadales bacterium]